MTGIQRLCVMFIVAGVVAHAILIASGTSFGGAYVLPGCLLTFGLMGIVVTWGENRR